MKPISALLLFTLGTALGQAAEPAKLKLHWAKNYLTIRGDHLPGSEIKIHYLEAYCRANSQTTDWSKHTVVGHKTRLVSRSADGSQLKLHCVVSDGVTVEHVITATHDEVDFRLTAHNPTNKRSEAHWAQPCIRVGKFTGTGADTTPDKVRLRQKELHLSRWQTRDDADAGLGHRGTLHPRAGLGRTGRAKGGRQSAATTPCRAQQRFDRLLQRGRLDDFCHRIRAVSGLSLIHI